MLAMNATEERFVKWEIPGLPRILDTPSLINDYENGFVLTLVEEKSDGRAFNIRFEQPLAFRSANERYRLKLISWLHPELPWPTFKVENSQWVDWFHDQSLGVYSDSLVEHYAFIGEDVIEVLSARPPICSEVERTSTYGWQ